MFTIDKAYAITIVAGDEGSFTYRLWADQDKTIPVDFTDYSFILRVARAPAAGATKLPPVVLTLSQGNGVSINGETVEFRFLEEHTKNMPTGSHIYQVEMRKNGGQPDTIINSTLELIPALN